MTRITFEARVINGKLQHQTPLDALEGQRVRVTLISVEADAAPPTAHEPSSDEPPHWMDVEKDV
jgi:hypothetical protein